MAGHIRYRTISLALPVVVWGQPTQHARGPTAMDIGGASFLANSRWGPLWEVYEHEGFNVFWVDRVVDG